MEQIYIIAEAGVNHNGSPEMALQLIDVAAEAGADAVKFQTFKAEQLAGQNVSKADYQIKATGAAESQYEMLKKLELDISVHKRLIEYCNRLGIEFLSTPFDLESVDLLAGTFDLPRIKVSSGDVTNAPLLLRIACYGKPVYLSTGMCNLGEIETALGVLAFGYTNTEAKPSLESFQNAYRSKSGQKALREKVVLLHCTTEYPAPFEEVNLRAMDTLRHAFGLQVGHSDHTPGIAVPIAAAARGACVIEKHFTLDRNLPGPDHRASLEPGELKAMVQSIRQVEKTLGSGLKGPAVSEIKNISAARKSIVAAKDIQKGETFREDNITVKRPGTGISPVFYWQVLGAVASKNYRKDEVIDL